MPFQAILGLSLLTTTTQLSLHSVEGDVEPDHDDRPQGGMMDFGGIFEMHNTIQEHFEHQAEAAELLGKHTGHTQRSDEETPDPADVGTPAPTFWHPQWKSDASGSDFSDRKWPTKAWKAPLEQGENYPGKNNWPLDTTKQCSEPDVKELNYWALKQAKKRLSRDGYDGTNFNGECFRYNFNGWALNVTNYAGCFQKFYNVSTPCAQCVGKVYNMAFFNWSQPCYDLCKGRPSRRDGAHWCWEDCQSCMWYIGRQLTTCYGEPYDMQCRYARELGKEEFFEKNGINPAQWNKKKPSQ